MKPQASLQQLTLLDRELPAWENLTPTQTMALKEVLAILLEQLATRAPRGNNSQKDSHV